MTKVNISPVNQSTDFSAIVAGIMPRNNGTPAGIEALRQSLERSKIDAYGNANETINAKCLNLQVKQANYLKANDQSSFERISEMLEVCHA